VGKYPDGRDGFYFHRVMLISNANIRFATVLSSAFTGCNSVDDDLWFLFFTA